MWPHYECFDESKRQANIHLHSLSRLFTSLATNVAPSMFVSFPLPSSRPRAFKWAGVLHNGITGRCLPSSHLLCHLLIIFYLLASERTVTAPEWKVLLSFATCVSWISIFRLLYCLATSLFQAVSASPDRAFVCGSLVEKLYAFPVIKFNQPLPSFFF